MLIKTFILKPIDRPRMYIEHSGGMDYLMDNMHTMSVQFDYIRCHIIIVTDRYGS